MALTTITNAMVSVNAIQGTLIADNAITAVHIATNAVSGTLIADNAITAVHIAQNVVTVTQLADDAVEADKIADGVITTNHLNKAMISSQTEVTAVAGDFVLLGDTSDSNNLKKALVSSLAPNAVPLAGGTMTGNLVVNAIVDADNFKINGGQGSDGQVLTSTGSGVAWESVSGGVAGISTSADATAITIDSSERVGIGMTSPAHVLSVYKAGDGQTPVRFNTGNNEPLDFYNDSETWKINAAQGIGLMAKGTGLITFYTTDSETECARWTNNRAFKTKQGTSAYANATSNYNEICSNADATANLLIRQGSTYYADCINLWYYAATGPNNTHSNFLHAFDQQATRAKIFSNGGFANYQSNDSNLCDEREKKNITTAPNTSDIVKSWNIKQFHYNEEEDSDAKRYGVIAQDIEKTNPEIIVDWEKNKASAQELWQEGDKPLPDGVSVGDEKSPAQVQVMRKAVKEQQMYIMAIKALQEAMTEIDSLKARVKTLEG
jgi:hypothetical protein